MVEPQIKKQPYWVRRELLITVGCIALVFVAFMVYATLNSTVISVKNDTKNSIVMSECGSDIVGIGPFRQISFDARGNEPKLACLVYSNDIYLGCLLTPTTPKYQAVVFKVSALDKSISETKCGI